MCRRHSFIVTPEGKVLDGRGLTDSHSAIAPMHGISPTDLSGCNLYEWQPPKGWPGSPWLEGLTVDRQTFVPKKSHDTAMKKHLLAKYPTKAAWDAGDSVDPALDGQTVMLDGSDWLIYCTGVHKVSSIKVRASGSSTVEAFGSSTVEAFGSSTVLLNQNCTRDVSVDIAGSAVVIDRMGGGITIFSAQPVDVLVQS